MKPAIIAATILGAIVLSGVAGLAWVCWQLDQADPDEWGGAR